MTARDRLDRGLIILLSILWLPARVIEEGIHAVAALPWASNVFVRLSPDTGDAETIVEYRDDAPDWAIRAAHVAPEIVATVAGIAVITWWIVNGTGWWPQTMLDFSLLAIFGAQWLAIALPSAQDMDHSAEATDA